MNEFWQIIINSPFWVWIILAEILFIGIISFKTRFIGFTTIFIIPLILIAFQYQVLLSDNLFTLMMIFTSVISFLFYKNQLVRIIKKDKLIEIPGNYSTLIVLLLFFIVKYYFGYLNHLDPVLALKYSKLENALTGLSTGYFVGLALSYSYKYIRAIEVE